MLTAKDIYKDFMENKLYKWGKHHYLVICPNGSEAIKTLSEFSELISQDLEVDINKTRLTVTSKYDEFQILFSGISYDKDSHHHAGTRYSRIYVKDIDKHSVYQFQYMKSCLRSTRAIPQNLMRMVV